MRDCEYYRGQISLAIDGELSPGERPALDAHLAACPDCLRFYNAMLEISDSLSGDLAEPPEELVFGVMDEIRRSGAPVKRRSHVWTKFAAAAACLVIVAAGAFALVRSGGAGTDASSADSAAAPELFSSTAETDEQAPSEEAAGSPYGDSAYEAAPESDGAAAPEGSDSGDTPDSGTDTGAESETESDLAALMDMTMAEIYTETPSEDDAAAPDLKITDAEALDSLARLLSFSECADEAVPETEPLFTIRVTDEDGVESLIRIWLDDDRLLLRFGEEDTVYVAEGTLDDLIAFINGE